MSLMSRFRKDKDKEDEEALEEGEEEGLLMAATPSREDRPEQDEPGAQEAVAALDPEKPDPLEPPAAEEVPPEPDSEEEESGSEDESSDKPGDDPMSMFRTTMVESTASDLAQEIEDIPIQELLSELREVRSLLPPSQSDTDAVA